MNTEWRKTVQAAAGSDDEPAKPEWTTIYQVRSWRGHMNEVTSLSVSPEWGGMLEDFCEVLGIDVSSAKVGWWLVSNWG